MAIQWRDQPILDSVQLPGSETKYWVADSEAREKIEALVGATRFMGVTTTELEDGDTTNPIIIDDKSYTAQTGDIVIYTPLTGPSLEFIWDGSKWQLLGGQAIEDLGDLAYKDSASGSYTPEGSISVTLESIGDGYTYVTDVSLGDLTVAIKESDQYIPGKIASINISGSVNLSTSNRSVVVGITGDIDTKHSLIEYISGITAPATVITSAPTVKTYSSVVENLIGGSLPSISNTNTMTATMGTGSSSTTLIFNLSDIGFNPGSLQSPEYGTVIGLSQDGSFTSSTISFTSASLTVVTEVSGGYTEVLSDIAIPVSGTFSDTLYLGTELSGNIGTTTDTMYDIAVSSATFTGSTSTITVS